VCRVEPVACSQTGPTVRSAASILSHSLIWLCQGGRLSALDRLPATFVSYTPPRMTYHSWTSLTITYLLMQFPKFADCVHEAGHKFKFWAKWTQSTARLLIKTHFKVALTSNNLNPKWPFSFMLSAPRLFWVRDMKFSNLTDAHQSAGKSVASVGTNVFLHCEVYENFTRVCCNGGHYISRWSCLADDDDDNDDKLPW
jgi:hypothetical protein